MGNAVTKGDDHHHGHHEDEEKGQGEGTRGEILRNEETPLVAASTKTIPRDDGHDHHHDGHNHHHDGHGHSHCHQNPFFHHDTDNNQCMVIINTKTNIKANITKTQPKEATDDPVLKRLKFATGLCCIFMLVEVIGGYLAGSLAILSDAAHLMADLASFAVAIIAAHLAARPSTQYHTYGLKRTESLAALFSMTTLAVISIGLALEAFRRIYDLTWGNTEETVDGKLMSGIATIGVLVNVALAAVLGEHHVHMPGHGHDHDHGHDHHDHSHGHSHNHDQHCSHNEPSNDDNNNTSQQQQRNVNLEAAYLHVLADLTQSVAILLAGLVIWWKPQWQIVDPIATVLFCILVFWSTLGVIRASVCVLLEEVPPTISWQTMYDSIVAVPGVCDVHDLHIWSISQGINAMSVHLRLEYYLAASTATTTTDQKSSSQPSPPPMMDYNDCAKRANQILKTVAKIAKQNGIIHSTIQLQHTTADDGDGIQQSCICCDLGGDESMAHNIQNQFR